MILSSVRSAIRIIRTWSVFLTVDTCLCGAVHTFALVTCMYRTARKQLERLGTVRMTTTQNETNSEAHTSVKAFLALGSN